MSEEIVACIGCGKKFKIPEGAAPSGSFDCTACGKPVKYGVAPPSSGAGRGKSGGAARSGGGRGARSSARSASSRAPAERESGRGTGRKDARERGATPQKENNTTPILFAIGGGVLVVFILVLVFAGGDKEQKTAATHTNGATTTDVHTGALSADGSGVAPTTTTPVAPADTPKTGETATTEPATTTPPVKPDTGIGGSATAGEDSEKPKDERYYYYLDDSKLFVRQESTKDTTEAERTEYEALVKDLTDFQSGKAGVVAESKLIKIGRKAVPALLSTFAGQTWESEGEQYGAFKVQQVLRAIVKADLPRNADFIARFDPRNPVPAEHFKRAARMWIAHWLGNLQYKDQFKSFDDAEGAGD